MAWSSAAPALSPVGDENDEAVCVVGPSGSAVGLAGSFRNRAVACGVWSKVIDLPKLPTRRVRRPLWRRLLRAAVLAVAAVVALFLALSLVPLRDTIPPMQAGPDTAYWTLRDGSRIAHIDLAPADERTRHGVPVIYLHGGPGGYIHSSIVARMRELSADGYAIHLYDQIGSGRSDRLRLPHDYSFQRHVDDLAEIVERHVGAPRVVLVAQSFGAMVAAHYVAAHPDRVAGVVFCSPGGLEPTPTGADGKPIDLEALYPAPAGLEFRAPAEVWAETDRQLLRPRVIMAMTCAMLFDIKWASDREMDGLINTMASRFTRGLVCDPARVLPEEGGGGGYAYMFSNWYDGVPDPRARLREIVVPTLVLQGQCDQGSYAIAYEYADVLRGRYVFVRDAGHEIWWDQPEVFVDHIRSFLRDVGSADAG